MLLDDAALPKAESGIVGDSGAEVSVVVLEDAADAVLQVREELDAKGSRAPHIHGDVGDLRGGSVVNGGGSPGPLSGEGEVARSGGGALKEEVIGGAAG